MFFMFFFSGFSQKATVTVKYTYDVSGNRITRNIIQLKSEEPTKNDTTEIVKLNNYQDEFTFQDKNSLKDNIGNHQIVVYPNPTKSIFFVKISDDLSSKNTTFILYNSNGQIILQEKNIINPLTKVDISSQPKGAYFLQIHVGAKTPNNISKWKIIKE